MTDDKWISVDKRSNRLVIRFWAKGAGKQFFIATGLKDTKRNREIVRIRRDAIATDIALGRFDDSLVSYQFGHKPAAKPQKPEVTTHYSLGELWELYTDFQSKQLEQTTIKSSYAAIARYIRKLPTQDLTQAVKIRDWLLNNISLYMAWDNLNYYRRCCDWAVNSQLIVSNPFTSLTIEKPKKKSTDTEDYRAFTLEQRNIIIEAFENNPSYSHYADLVKFLFLTGCRPGEAFALTWGDISSDCCLISISKSRNLHGILKGTKNGKKRVFPTSPNSKLQKLLLNRRTEASSQDKIIFPTKLGNKMTSYTLNDIWKGTTSTSSNGKKYFYLGVVSKLVAEGKLPYYLKPYAARHTFATWAISSGISPDKVAKWLGDDIQTVLLHYTHPNVVNASCPDF
ncbi:tyrosine-type recombinase/integrase [Halotia branconii]|uniref:Tyrosine-type recombinase/integrase n=1 Tax=Halotia branconii CENA392 TaxID=1539056 RepID=A0AAJ6NNB0_9CYAN|nr:tyrosine-type recombinase/integrase [Halotia branconii]WGV23683.1 tyrosine-type recombinase/integrase [Halotia branconii CENA392]